MSTTLDRAHFASLNGEVSGSVVGPQDPGYDAARAVHNGLDTAVECFATVPSPMTAILFEHFHGAVTRVGPTETAVPHRDEGWNLLIPSVWIDPADDALFVALDAGGTITRSSGATDASRASAGVYRIAFGAEITNCVYLPTAGKDDGGSLVEDYHLYTSRTGTSTVNVEIFDENDNSLDLPFFLAVVC
jgi:hypothetical protein